MTGADLLAIPSTSLRAGLPLIVIGYGAVMVLLVGAFWKSHSGVAALTVATLAGAMLSLPAAAHAEESAWTLYGDAFTPLYLALFCAGGLVVAVIGWDYLKPDPTGSERFYALLLLAILGMGVLAASDHFVSFFLGLETLSVSLYGLIGFTLKRRASLEGALKYLVLAGVSASFLLFGMALVYSESGHMSFGELSSLRLLGLLHLSPVVLLGVGMMLVGFAFKLAVAPFHAWAPDVYQGAPAPAAALLATGSKAAVFALLLRFVALFDLLPEPAVFLLITVLAIITMFAGNLLALLQQNLKRLLGYSAVAHIGYLLVALLAGGPAGASAIWFYFVAYFAAVIGAFGVIAALASQGEELEQLSDYQGLGLRRPWLGGALALMMLSLAGIPPTAGFIAKLYLFSAAARAGLWALLVIGLLNSGLAVYYYLRVLVALYLRPAQKETKWPRTRLGTGVALAALSGLVILLGLYPGPVISGAQEASSRWPPQPPRINWRMERRDEGMGVTARQPVSPGGPGSHRGRGRAATGVQQ